MYKITGHIHVSLPATLNIPLNSLQINGIKIDVNDVIEAKDENEAKYLVLNKYSQDLINKGYNVNLEIDNLNAEIVEE